MPGRCAGVAVTPPVLPGCKRLWAERDSVGGKFSRKGKIKNHQEKLERGAGAAEAGNPQQKDLGCWNGPPAPRGSAGTALSTRPPCPAHVLSSLTRPSPNYSLNHPRRLFPSDPQSQTQPRTEKAEPKSTEQGLYSREAPRATGISRLLQQAQLQKDPGTVLRQS